MEELRRRLEPFHLRQKEFVLPDELSGVQMSQPPWICQPYVRPPPEEHLKKMQQIRSGIQQGRGERKLKGPWYSRTFLKWEPHWGKFLGNCCAIFYLDKWEKFACSRPFHSST